MYMMGNACMGWSRVSLLHHSGLVMCITLAHIRIYGCIATGFAPMGRSNLGMSDAMVGGFVLLLVFGITCGMVFGMEQVDGAWMGRIWKYDRPTRVL